MNTSQSSLIYDFAYLMHEMERATTPEEVRGVLKVYRNKIKYEKIVANDGLEAIAWIGKQYVKMKEENNARCKDDPA